MTVFSAITNVAKKVTGRPGPLLLTVKQAWRLTPNMIRVTFSGPELDGFPTNSEGGNCKLLLPDPDESRADFEKRLSERYSLTMRTYTIRKFDETTKELSIDFVAHGDDGPASRWASHAKSGAFLGFAGPSTPKITYFDADWYLVAADPSALPVAAVALEAMPRDAKGVAIFEITSKEDRQEIDIPEGFETHWLVHSDPQRASEEQEILIRSLDWPKGKIQTCIAGESGVIRSLRAFLTHEKNLPKEDIYISGYWKIGLIEDEHQKAKRAEAV